MGLGYMTAQVRMRFWFAILVVLGLTLLAGVVLAVVELLSLRPAMGRDCPIGLTGHPAGLYVRSLARERSRGGTLLAQSPGHRVP